MKSKQKPGIYLTGTKRQINDLRRLFSSLKPVAQRNTVVSCKETSKIRRAAKCAFYSATRAASKKLRTPKWLTEGHLIEIEYAYKLAKDRSVAEGIPYEVDHIIPLQGKNVSGLHVPWNLQILTEKENNRKLNKFSVAIAA